MTVSWTAIGCQPFDHYDRSLEARVAPAFEPPRELAKVSLPAYRIEPPDVLSIEVFRMVPLEQYRIETYDVLYLRIFGTLPRGPNDPGKIEGGFLVDQEGRINLGPEYGKVRVAGMTIDEATRAIDTHLRQYLKMPEVQVEQGQRTVPQPLSSDPQNGNLFLVTPDGSVNLRQYGAVRVAGKTLEEARVAIEQQLSQFFDSPKVSLNVSAYNSKVYYIITAGAGIGDNVVRVPVVGNETVLDGVSQVQGLSQISSKKIWIARPAPHGFHCEQILPVDWDAIAQGGGTSTNYQLLPGDRLYIAADEAITLNNWLNKMIQPVERVMGFSTLTASTVRNFKFIGSQNVGSGGF